MARIPPPQVERCDACRTNQAAPLQRLTVERVEVVVCAEAGPCIRRAEANGVWKMREALV
jgi:hypothetical protein